MLTSSNRYGKREVKREGDMRREGQREGGWGKEGAASSLLALRCSCNASNEMSNESKTFNSMMSGQPTQCVRGTEAGGGRWVMGLLAG